MKHIALLRRLLEKEEEESTQKKIITPRTFGCWLHFDHDSVQLLHFDPR